MDGLEVHALRIFLEAAKTLNFSEAGRNLSLTQPAVSMQIRSLEEYLDVKLFDRGPQRMRLTHMGETLVPLAQQIVGMVVSTEETMRSAASEVAGELIIGSSATVGKYLLPHLVARFVRQYPDVQVSILVVDRDLMMSGVVSGEYDLGVTSLRVPEYTDVAYLDFCEDHLALIAPVTHPWARRDLVRPQELLSEAFICREPDSACRYIVSSALGAVGVSMDDLRIVMQVGSAEALAMGVEHGIGMSFVSMLAAVSRVALGRLSIINVEGLTLQSPVEMVVSRSRAASTALTKFLEFVDQPQNHRMLQLLAEGRMV